MVGHKDEKAEDMPKTRISSPKCPLYRERAGKLYASRTRINTEAHINSQTLQEIGNLIRFVEPSDMLPVEYFAGDRMSYRKIGIVDIAAHIKPAFISKSNTVIKQEHIDQGFRFGADVVAVNCFDSEVLRMLRIAFIFGMHPFIEFLVHRNRKRRIILSQTSRLISESA